jgi:uncharacterized alpha-E superfamily protein
MLSRVADALYWTARYVERAEDTSRLLHVNFHGLLDTDIGDRGDAWRDLLRVIGADEAYRANFDEYTARSVSEFLLWHPENPDSVAACIARARENARGVREQISSEMWERLNRLHLDVARRRRSAVLAHPHVFLAAVMGGSQAFQGVTGATLPRGEPYEFLVLGTNIERAAITTRIVSIKLGRLFGEAGEEVAISQATDVLKSCGSLEAFQKVERDRSRPERVLAHLLLDRRGPRTVLFCLERSLASIRAISHDGQRPERAVGRVVAELTFTDDLAREPEAVAALVGRSLRGISEAGLEIATAYFTTRVIVPGPYTHQQQQQQQ